MASRRGTRQQTKAITVGAKDSLLINYLAIQSYELSVQRDVFSTIDSKVFLIEAFMTAPIVENEAHVQVELGLEEENVEELNDASQIRPSLLQALNSPNM